jgi:hypothetical protein
MIVLFDLMEAIGATGTSAALRLVALKGIHRDYRGPFPIARSEVFMRLIKPGYKLKQLHPLSARLMRLRSRKLVLDVTAGTNVWLGGFVCTGHATAQAAPKPDTAGAAFKNVTTGPLRALTRTFRSIPRYSVNRLLTPQDSNGKEG